LPLPAVTRPPPGLAERPMAAAGVAVVVTGKRVIGDIVEGGNAQANSGARPSGTVSSQRVGRVVADPLCLPRARAISEATTRQPRARFQTRRYARFMLFPLDRA
jgi:hypothetical protein